jgi:hypothetical protein
MIMIMAAAGVFVPHHQIEEAENDNSDPSDESQNPEVPYEVGIDALAGHKVAHDAPNHDEHHRLQQEEKPARPLGVLVSFVIMVAVVAVLMSVIVTALSSMHVFVIVRAFVCVDVFMFVSAAAHVFLRGWFFPVRVSAASGAVVMMVVVIV